MYGTNGWYYFFVFFLGGWFTAVQAEERAWRLGDALEVYVGSPAVSIRGLVDGSPADFGDAPSGISGDAWFRVRLSVAELGISTGSFQLRHQTGELLEVYRWVGNRWLPLDVRPAFGGFVSRFSVDSGQDSLRFLLKIRPLHSLCPYRCLYLERVDHYLVWENHSIRGMSLLAGMGALLFLGVGLWGRWQLSYPALFLSVYLLSGLLATWLHGGFLWRYPSWAETLIWGLLLGNGLSWQLFWQAYLSPTRYQIARWSLVLLLLPLMAAVLGSGYFTLLSLLVLLLWGLWGLVFMRGFPVLLAGQGVYLLGGGLLLAWWLDAPLHPFLDLYWPASLIVGATMGTYLLWQRYFIGPDKEAQMRQRLLEARLSGLHIRLREQEKDLQQSQQTIEKQSFEIDRQQNELRIRTRMLEEKNQRLQQVLQVLSDQKEELQLQNDEMSMKSSLIKAQKDLAAQTYKQFKVLKEIGEKLSSSLYQEEIIEIAYQSIQSFVEAEGFGVGIYYPQRKEVWFVDERWLDEAREGQRVSLFRQNRLLAFVLEENRELLLNDYRKDYQKYIGQAPPAQEHPGIESLIYLPLSTRKSVIGVLSLQHTKKHAFSYEQLDMLKSLGQFLAVSLDNARSYERIAHINEQMNAQNYQIMSSLRYAQTVQQAILPQAELLTELFREHFVIFMPRDLVSGDFYWVTRAGGYAFLAVVDCTGHGVPGAFMSMVGHSLLNQIINEQGHREPARILSELNRGVIHLLQQNKGQNTDGMDLSLCRISAPLEASGEVEVTFAGAKSAIFYTQKEKVILLRGDRLSIGGIRPQKNEFTQTTFTLQEGEQLYLSTDGYMDQNNDKKQKIGRHRFHGLLKEIQFLPMTMQHYRLGELLAEHKKGEEQRDDITVIGVRI
ncbi:MAG: GAF domain-containing SpoIIE family protein phosphatase [Bernardetiaceae bacterium]